MEMDGYEIAKLIPISSIIISIFVNVRYHLKDVMN